MAAARREGALVMVHAENHGMISWLAGRLVKQGNTLPRYHAICHTRGSRGRGDRSASSALAELVDCPILDRARVEPGGHRTRSARRATRGAEGLRRDLPAVPVPDRQGHRHRPRRARSSAAARRRATRRRRRRAGAASRTARCTCTPPTTRPTEWTRPASCRRASRRPSRRWRTACRASSCACRCCSPTAYKAGRLTLEEFVNLTATRHAQTYGLYPRKGTIAVGSDADHRASGIPRPESASLRGSWCTTTPATRPTRAASSPAGRTTVLSRGEPIVENGSL